MRFSRPAIASLLLAGMMAVPLPALAGGFYLQEQSPKETGRALSGGAAAADDPSTVYFNPAGMTQLPGIQTSAGAVLLFPSTQQKNRGTTRTPPPSGPFSVPVTLPVTGGSGGDPFDSMTPVPSFYATAQLTDRLWLGLAVAAPFGLKLDYDADFFGRYDSLHTDLKTYNVQPSAAYRLTDALSVGGGVDLQYAKVTLTNALPNLSPAAADGLARIKGDDLSIGWNAGLFYTSGGTNWGIHYRSGMKHRIEGSATLSHLSGPLQLFNGTTHATAPLNLPDIVTVSMTRRLTPQARAMLTARWYNWSVFQDISITSGTGTSVKELHYRDSYSVSAGGEYDVSRALTLRAGTMFDRTPTNPQYLTTRVPDGDRVWLSGGATWNMASALALNLSYAHNFVGKANLIRTENSLLTTITTRSLTSGNADQIAASVTARF
ncbi:MAG TPA: outer membrane protein transport protein [Novosphingobium sp.]|nr:outer membrane protein transport protein [Novosphingobium sp.]